MNYTFDTAGDLILFNGIIIMSEKKFVQFVHTVAGAWPTTFVLFQPHMKDSELFLSPFFPLASGSGHGL